MDCNSVKISIIMPVYNSEKYLRGAVDCILAQDYENYELILVDDGSRDNSGKICDAYADMSAKVRVIHKENGGICSARNAGLEAAKGEYIGFSDNDDEILPHMLSDNARLLDETAADLVRYERIKRNIRADGKSWDEVKKPCEGFARRDQFGERFRDVRSELTVWTGFYRKEIIDRYHIRFDERYRHGVEDVQFNICFLQHCDSICFNPKAYYIWCQRETHSTSKSFHMNYVHSLIHNLKLEEKCLKDIYETVSMTEKVRFLTDKYIFNLCDYLTSGGCALSHREKRKILATMRQQEIFDQFAVRQLAGSLLPGSIKTYLVAWLFEKHAYSALLCVTEIGERVLGIMRYRSSATVKNG